MNPLTVEFHVPSSASRFQNPQYIAVYNVAYVSKSHSPSFCPSTGSPYILGVGRLTTTLKDLRAKRLRHAEAPTWLAQLGCQPNTILAWLVVVAHGKHQRQTNVLPTWHGAIQNTQNSPNETPSPHKETEAASQLPRSICDYSHVYTLAPNVPVLRWTFRQTAWAWLKPRCPGAHSVQVMLSSAYNEDLLAVPV